MILLALTAIGMASAGDDLKPPKRPFLGDYWRVVDLRNANEMEIKSVIVHEGTKWERLYGIDVPDVGHKGYSGARQDLEIILGRAADVYFEDEKKDHPISRNAYYVQYIWTRGKLIEFEMVRDGWATVNDEGRKGRYSKYLIAAEDEAKEFRRGIWAAP